VSDEHGVPDELSTFQFIEYERGCLVTRNPTQIHATDFYRATSMARSGRSDTIPSRVTVFMEYFDAKDGADLRIAV
jgi:hypothetical protein